MNDRMPSLRDALARYTAMDAPAGYEEPVLRAARDELAALGASVEVDRRGNVYGHISGRSAAARIMLTAHADEIGLQVTQIRSDGFLRVTKIGGPTDMVLPGQKVKVLSEHGPVAGLIGVKPGHVLRGPAAQQIPDVETLYIDVGADSAAMVQSWGIQVGTPLVFDCPLTHTHNSTRVFGKAVDNRCGVVAVLELARRLQADPAAADVDIVIAVEEEIGLRGAAVAAARLQPDILLAIDTVPCGGTPDLTPEELPWRIGGGPLLKVRESRGLATHGPLRARMCEVAAARNLAYQLIIDTAGMTDATSGQQASADIAAMVVGIPRRYSHSAVELLDLSDLLQAIDLLEATVRSVDSCDFLQTTLI